MPSESEDISPSVSMLSEVSGMDNSLSLAEIDRIISNLIGKEAEHNLALGPDEHQSFVSELGALGDADGARGSMFVPESPNMANVSMNFEDIPPVQASPLLPRESVLSPAVQRLLSQSALGSPTAGAYAHDSPTDVPSYVSPPPAPAGNGMMEHFPEDAGNIDMPRPNSWDSSRSPTNSGAPQHFQGPVSAPTAPGFGGLMPLQKITLFRKSIDDDRAASGLDVSIGISCAIDAGTGHVIITEVLPGGAAYNSGQVYQSDMLLQINGTSVTGMPTEKVRRLLGGEAGTPVSILVSHNPELFSPPPEPLREITSLLPSWDPPPSMEATRGGILSEAEQEAEERRLVREKVLAKRRMIMGGAAPDFNPPRSPTKAIASDSSGDDISPHVDDPAQSTATARRRSATRSAPRPPPDAEGPSPPVSAVFPLPPAALGNKPDQPDPTPTNVLHSRMGDSQLYSRSSDLRYRNQKGDAGSMPEGSHVFRLEADAPSPEDAQGKSLAELKMSFTTRMNEAIRMQRERMQSLLSDVDSKIVSLKKEHGLREETAGDNADGGQQAGVAQTKAVNQSGILPVFPAIKFDSDNKENDISAESQYSSVDTIITPVASSRPVATRGAALTPPTSPAALNSEMAGDIFSPGMIERDLQTEKLMKEMAQLREALAAVTGSVSRTASASGEALLPEPSCHAELEEDDPNEGDEQDVNASGDVGAMLTLQADGWLLKKRSPSVQRASPTVVRPFAEAEANLLALAEHSKQKYLDIISRLQKESLKSDTAHVDQSVQSVDDHENTIDSVSDEDGQADADADTSQESEFLQLSYNPALQPAKGCITKTRKLWPTRPVSPPATEAERSRFANRGQKRSVLGAGIAASKEVLNPGKKTPYSPRHVMTPNGPMVLAPEGPVPPSQHPFVQEQMVVLKCIKQYPALAQMPAEVVKAAALVYDMGLEPELVCIGEGESSDQQHAETQERNPRKLAFAEGVAASDGNSAQRLHEASLAKRKAALAAAQEAASKHAEMLEKMQEQHDQIQVLQSEQGGVQLQTPLQHPHPQYAQQQQLSHPQRQQQQQLQLPMYNTPQKGAPPPGTPQMQVPNQRGGRGLAPQGSYFGSAGAYGGANQDGWSSGMSPGGPLPSAAPVSHHPSAAPMPHHAANNTPNKTPHGGPQRPGAMQQQQQHPMPPSPNYYGQPRPHPGRQPMIDASPMPRGLAPGWGNQQQQPTPQQQQQMQMRKSLGGGTVQVPNTKAQLQQHMPQMSQALNMTPNISGKHMRMSLPG